MTVCFLSVTVGSVNDLPMLKERGIFSLFDEVIRNQWRLDVISADRNAPTLDDFVQHLTVGGVKVFWAFAGKENVLATAIKAQLRALHSVAPVFAGAMDWEGLYASLYKPAGIAIGSAGPGLDGAFNTALLACEVVALNDPFVAERLKKYYEQTAKSAVYRIDPESIQLEKSPDGKERVQDRGLCKVSSGWHIR